MEFGGLGNATNSAIPSYRSQHTDLLYGTIDLLRSLIRQSF
jgi:hypothetical protein